MGQEGSGPKLEMCGVNADAVAKRRPELTLYLGKRCGDIFHSAGSAANQAVRGETIKYKVSPIYHWGWGLHVVRLSFAQGLFCRSLGVYFKYVKAHVCQDGAGVAALMKCTDTDPRISANHSSHVMTKNNPGNSPPIDPTKQPQSGQPDAGRVGASKRPPGTRGQVIVHGIATRTSKRWAVPRRAVDQSPGSDNDGVVFEDSRRLGSGSGDGWVLLQNWGATTEATYRACHAEEIWQEAV